MQKKVFETFKKEMEIVKPEMIIALSQEVQKTLRDLFSKTPIDTDIVLPHPYWCSIGRNREIGKRKYLEALIPLVKR